LSDRYHHCRPHTPHADTICAAAAAAARLDAVQTIPADRDHSIWSGHVWLCSQAGQDQCFSPFYKNHVRGSKNGQKNFSLSLARNAVVPPEVFCETENAPNLFSAGAPALAPPRELITLPHALKSAGEWHSHPLNALTFRPSPSILTTSRRTDDDDDDDDCNALLLTF